MWISRAGEGNHGPGHQGAIFPLSALWRLCDLFGVEDPLLDGFWLDHECISDRSNFCWSFAVEPIYWKRTVIHEVGLNLWFFKLYSGGVKHLGFELSVAALADTLADVISICCISWGYIFLRSPTPETNSNTSRTFAVHPHKWFWFRTTTVHM